MSDPETDEERRQAALTLSAAGPAELLVSTACVWCGTGFAMLARYVLGKWKLRCTACTFTCKGELK